MVSMKKYTRWIYAIIFYCLPVMSIAQEKGIVFAQGSWQDVLATAKKENKYIFLDCYASWCGPCKLMDRDIYPQEKVGDFFTDKFIAVKIQLDSSKSDNEEVKDRYADAQYIIRQYKIDAFPTLLFFSPDGQLVHKAIGFKDMESFIALGTDALNPAKQYYVQLEKYSRRELGSANKMVLLREAQSLNDKEVVQEIARENIQQIFASGDKVLYTKDNINFIREFTETSKDPGFSLLYKHKGAIDKLMEDSTYAQDYVDYIIAKEEIDAVLWPTAGGSPALPDWIKMQTTITKKYNKRIAYRTITGAKVRWYGWKKDWPEYSKYLVAKWEISKGTSKDFLTLDNEFYFIFQHSNNQKDLNKVIVWMDQLFQKNPSQMDPQNMDTYANLLYKTGHKQKALLWEEKASKGAPDDKEIQANYNKIRKDEPTWAVN